MKLNLIVAKGLNNEIGAGNRLLWRLPSDMKFFKDTTMGHVVVMGRKTWESIGSKRLEGRLNIILTKEVTYQLRNPYIRFMTKEEFLENCEDLNREIFIIGGEQIYREFANIADVMYITEVEQSFPQADTFFPEIHGAFNKELLQEGTENGISYKTYKYERVK